MSRAARERTISLIIVLEAISGSIQAVMPVVKQLKKIRKGEKPWTEGVRRTGRRVVKQQKELEEIGITDGMTSGEMWLYFEEEMTMFAAELEENSAFLVKQALRQMKEHSLRSSIYRADWALQMFRQGLFVCLFV